MKRNKLWIICILALVVVMLSTTAFALDESEVENAVAASSRDEVAGNLFIWFLCAVSFLKISQKIDSFMSSLGVNVGRTGGSMLAELRMRRFAWLPTSVSRSMRKPGRERSIRTGPGPILKRNCRYGSIMPGMFFLNIVPSFVIGRNDMPHKAWMRSGILSFARLLIRRTISTICWMN